MNAPITTTPAGDILANIHELEWLDVGGGTGDIAFGKSPINTSEMAQAIIDRL